MKMLFMIIFGTLLFSATAFSMGDDKPGPNGGYIKMPGTYHVELVDKGNKMEVYLLDLSMKNPTVENSSVSLKFVNTNSIEINCKSEKNYFVCIKPKDKLITYKEIIVETIRNKVKAKSAI